MKYAFCTIALCMAVLLQSVQAQPLTLDDAIGSALSQNLNIKIAKNQTRVAENNTTRGNAGAMPSVTASGSYSGSLTNSKLVFAGNAQPPIEVDGAQAATLSGNLTAQYVLFNGFLAQNTYSRLDAQRSLSQVQEQLQIESTILGVINAYFLGLQIQQNLASAKSSLDISKRRYERAKLRAEFGSATNIAKLNAEVDLNNDSIAVLDLEQQLQNAKNNLAYLIGGGEDAVFDLVDDFQLESLSVKEELLATAQGQNATVLQARRSLEVSENDVAVSKASLYPTLSVSAAYQYNRNVSDANFLSENRSAGLNGGLSLSYSLFRGGQSQIQRENAIIAWENNQIRQEDALLQLSTQIDNAYAAYTNGMAVYKLRQKALEVNRLNFARSEELFKNGQITGTEFREAQLNLVNAEVQEQLSKISAKLSEYELLRLTGALVQGGE